MEKKDGWSCMDIGYELYQIKTIQNRMLELPITDFNLHKDACAHS